MVGGIGNGNDFFGVKKQTDSFLTCSKKGNSLSFKFGNNFRNGVGLITAPERRCAPGYFPFSKTAMGKSPRLCKISGISFNYDRKESDLSLCTPEELVSLYEKESLGNFSLIDAGGKDITKVLADIGQGKKLWKWCIILVLLFLSIETALLRLWK